MADNVIPFRKGGASVRWDVIERLVRWYMVGACGDDPEHELLAALSDDEREAFRWEIGAGDARLHQMMEAMKSHGADSLAQLGKPRDGAA